MKGWQNLGQPCESLKLCHCLIKFLINVFSFSFHAFSVSFRQLPVPQQRTMDLIYSPIINKRLFLVPEIKRNTCILIGQDNRKKISVKLSIFPYPSVLTYDLGAQKNRLIETVLLSTHNIYFGWEIRKWFCDNTLLTRGIILIFF